MIDIGKPPDEPEQKPADIGDASRFGEFNFNDRINNMITKVRITKRFLS